MYIIISILLVAVLATAMCLQRRKAKRTKSVYTYSALPLLAFAFVFETWHYVVLGLVGLIVVVAVISIATKAVKRKKDNNQPSAKLDEQKQSMVDEMQTLHETQQASEHAEQPEVVVVEQTEQVVAEQQPVAEEIETEDVQVEPVAEPYIEETVVADDSQPQVEVVEEVAQTQPEVTAEQQPRAVETVTVVEEVVPVAEKSTTTATVANKSTTTRTRSKKTNESDDTLIRYNKSFTAKIVLGDDEVRDRYNEIKNHIMSFEGVKSRMSWYNETFRYKRLPVAKLALRGKTLTLYVALNPSQYVDAPYTVDDCSDVKRYKDFPSAIKLKGSRTEKFGEEMITTRLAELQTYQNAMYETQDFRLPYRPFTTLLEEKLIKEIIVHKGTSGVKRLAGAGELILKRVEAEEADELLEDEVAATMVESRQNGVSATGKKGIVNIGELTTIYNDGDTVTLQDLKDKKIVARDVERLKVLADGYLDKKLIVEAQDFSMDAIKMIVLTGGKAVKVD